MGGIDAHHHLWRVNRGDYSWLTPASGPLYRDFGLAELEGELAQSGIEGTVLVQAAPTSDETRYLLALARQSRGRIRGVVGWADLAASDALDALNALSRDPLLKGVRPMLQDTADPAWIARPEIGPALRELSDLRLCFDALVRAQHLPALLEVIERHPDLAVVVDHGGKPDIAAGAWQPWADALQALARHPGVHCKLSGLVTEAGRDWTVDQLQPYVDHVFACFGARRVMWGSDWPVLTLAASYCEWSNATDRLLAGLTPAEQACVRRDNAIRFYALELV